MSQHTDQIQDISEIIHRFHKVCLLLNSRERNTANYFTELVKTDEKKKMSMYITIVIRCIIIYF